VYELERFGSSFESGNEFMGVLVNQHNELEWLGIDQGGVVGVPEGVAFEVGADGTAFPVLENGLSVGAVGSS
jgi:hypothetical protein